MKRVLPVLSAIFLLFPTAQMAQQPAAGSDPLAKCAESLVAYADWEKVRDPVFSLELTSRSGGSLYYFGARHANDPADPQFAEIEAAWNKAKPTVAFYEGPNRPIAESRDETIKAAGESGYVRFLAKRDGVPFLSLEPSPLDEAGALLRRFTPEQVKLFFVLRETARLRDRMKMEGPQLTAAVEKMLARISEMERSAGFKGFENTFATVAELEAAYRRHWKTPAEWWQAPSEWFDPGKSSAQTGGVFTNEINRASSEQRDRHMYEVLAKAALEGKKVFAVVGRNHVPMQGPALRCALK